VEFRNHTWMTDDNQRETLDFLSAHRLPYVCVDEPQGYSNSIPPVLAATSDLAVIRLHGHSDQWESHDIQERFRYRYDGDELAAGRQRQAAGGWRPTPTRPTWCSTTATATTRTSTRGSWLGWSASVERRRAASTAALPHALLWNSLRARSSSAISSATSPDMAI
jgi:hypothetical protein